MSKTHKHLLLTYIAQGWSSFLSVASIPIFIRQLGVDAYAFVGLLLAMCAVLSLVDVVATPIVNLEIATLKDRIDSKSQIYTGFVTLERMGYILLLPALLLVYLVSWSITTQWQFNNTQEVGAPIIILLLLALISMLKIPEGIYKAYTLAFELHDVFSFVTIIVSSIRWILGILIVSVFNLGLLEFFELYLFASFIGICIYRLSLKKYFESNKINAILDYSMLTRNLQLIKGVITIAIVSLLLTQIDKLIVGKSLGITDFAYYTLCANIAAAIFITISPITQVAFPKIANAVAKNDNAYLRSIYHLVCRGIAIVVSSVVCVGAYNAVSLLYLWTGDMDIAINAAPVLKLMLLSVLFNSIAWGPYQIQLAYGWTSLNIKLSLILLPLYVAGLIISTYLFGVVGVAICATILNFTFAIVGTYCMHIKVLPGDFLMWLRKDVALPSLGSLLATILVAFFEPTSLSITFVAPYLIASLLVSILFAYIFAFGFSFSILNRVYIK